jgi:phosphoribosylanthranilate isomerase
MRTLKIKVCGMREPENIREVLQASPDYLGYIFHPKSKRFVGEDPKPEIFSLVPKSTQKVGVFVNEDLEKVRTICANFNLEVAQLHGNESPEYCHVLKENGLQVFKAFSVGKEFDFSLLENYIGTIDYFLFDTKGKLPGGTGLKFNWDILESYTWPVPFILSGGIKPGDVEALSIFNHKQLYALDINSGFEINPAEKDSEKVIEFISQIRKSAI